MRLCIFLFFRAASSIYPVKFEDHLTGVHFVVYFSIHNSVLSVFSVVFLLFSLFLRALRVLCGKFLKLEKVRTERPVFCPENIVVLLEHIIFKDLNPSHLCSFSNAYLTEKYHRQCIYGHGYLRFLMG